MFVDRSKFIYKLYSHEGRYWGTTTDMYSLPVGFKFTVENGIWDGEIIEKEGIKYILVIDTGMLIELKEDVDYRIVAKVR